MTGTTLFWLVAGGAFTCSVGPAVLFCSNLRLYRHPPLVNASEAAPPRVSVLIPARNEEAHVGEALRCVLASRGVALDVLVYDDASTDRTAEIVRWFAQQDARVQLVEGVPLPKGWNGKQHACWRLAQASGRAALAAPLLLFLDADVRLSPECIACSAQALANKRKANNIKLLSGFPRLITVGWTEKLLLPLIHFVLLSYLPMRLMQTTSEVGFAAGCGQFMLVDREAYFATGGHRAIRETRHDGLRLPQAFRRRGYRTDLIDLTELARVRMYSSPGAVWNGLAKNATEGMAAPQRIVPFTVLLLLGQVLPVLLALLIGCASLLLAVVSGEIHFNHRTLAYSFYSLLLAALLASFVPRLIAVRRFHQPLLSALLHPLGVLLLLALQWYALGRQVLGKPVHWRTRTYASGTGKEVV